MRLRSLLGRVNDSQSAAEARHFADQVAARRSEDEGSISEYLTCGHVDHVDVLQAALSATERLATFAAWEAEVARISKHYDPNADMAIKDALGLAGEVGEVVELIKKDRFQSQPLDRAKLCLELGDVLWYLTNMAAGFGLTLEDVANANRDKLRKRYPTGFTPGGGVR